MRLDQFLKVSRLIPRRSVAQEFCDAGLIDVNDVRAKPAKEVKSGDVIEIRRRDRSIKVRVVELPVNKQIARSAAQGLYELISEARVNDDLV